MPKKGEKIYRVRRTHSNGQGGANFYYHADIEDKFQKFVEKKLPAE